MKTISQIRTELDTLPEREPITHLNYYRNNQLHILSINPRESIDHFNTKTQTLSIFGKLLVNNGNYSEAYDILTRAKETYDSDPFKSVNFLEDSSYRQVMFNLGVAAYKNKNKETAQQLFTRLLELDPRNDNYKEWLKAIKIERFAYWDKYFFYAFLAWLVIDVFIGDLFTEPFNTINLYLGIILLITSISMGIVKRRIQKKE
jgi:tetratricopeptide (TPR) repeat protein